MVRLIAKNVHTTISGQLDSNPRVAEQFEQQLRTELSYMVANADYSAKFKEKKWDGRISLYNPYKRTFPTGLMNLTLKWLKSENIQYTIDDERYVPEQNTVYTTRFAEFNRDLRFYQTEACNRAQAKKRGILAIATGGGKTMLTCELVSRLNVAPLLFIVPSQSLLEQTRGEFLKFILQDGEIHHIGIIGDGLCDINPNGINVATYQSLLAAYDQRFLEKSTVDPITKKKRSGPRVENIPENERRSLSALQYEYDESVRLYNQAVAECKRKYQTQFQAAECITKEKEREKALRAIERNITKDCKKYKEVVTKCKTALNTRIQTLENQSAVRELCMNVGCFIVDEAHIAAVITEALGEKMHKAYYRFGLTATPFREDNQDIRMEGTLGKKLIEISASDLIDLGFLVPPYIYMVNNDYTEQSLTWAETYRKHIVECWPRNYRIKQFAEAFKEEGWPTIILVEQKDHGYILENMIKDSVFVPSGAGNEEYEEVMSEEEKSYRRLMLDAAERNEIILIATQWANTGIDAPRLMALILAGSNKSAGTTYQQVGRILRTVGKDYNESVLNGKPFAVVIDFMESQKQLHKHSVRRKKVYQREHAFNVKVVG